MIHFKDTKNKSPLNTRWAQMTKQEQIIERKKMEIQAKAEAQKQAAALAAQAKLANPNANDDNSANIFSNDGSFMNQFKALLEKQNQDNAVKLQNEQNPEDDDKKKEDGFDGEKRKSNELTSREKRRRWNERHNPQLCVMPHLLEEHRNMPNDPNTPSINMISQIPVNHNDDCSDSEQNDWSQDQNDSNPPPDLDSEQNQKFRPMVPGLLPPGPLPPGTNIPQCPLPPGNWDMINHRPIMAQRPNMGPGGPMMGPPGSNMPPMPPFMGGPPNFPMPPNWGPNGPRGPCGPMPPNMMGPNGPMPPFFPPFNHSMMGMNGPPPPPPGPPSSMGQGGPPNSMMGHNGCPMNRPPNLMTGPNRPPRPPGPLMGQNGPNLMSGHNRPPGGPNSMMPPGTMPMGPLGNMPFMGSRPPFGSNPNFNSPNIPFMPPNSRMHSVPEPNTLETIPPPEPMKLQNIPPPMPLPLNHIPKPKDLELRDIPAPTQSSRVFSPDMFAPSVFQAASEVAANGDRWENVLKAIHTQDQNMWFLHNTKGPEYKAFRQLVEQLRVERETRSSVKDEDKYEPEFCLDDDDDSNDAKPHFKDESNSNNGSGNFWQQYSAKREGGGSSQSDDDSAENKRERRKRKKKSRWGDEPPMDLKPPGIMDIKPPGVAPPLLPPGTMMPAMLGPQLSKLDEDGMKLTGVNRNNHALMQYAMTNYGSTNLDPEDWKKCEDNFKLNLLYQDMLKKRNEVERLAAAGKHKYEYDSDEDTSAGTWEHKLRSREMNATEKWADELTKQAAGKHHIGDFLPPEELRKFMEKYSAAKSGKEPDLSDYKEFKLKEDNVGFKMLQKFGWSEGQGLGADGSGIVDPINKANQPVANLGLGANTSDIVLSEDDEFDAYRKRMMLAYRFRPNPLNNPRRPYY